MDSFTRIDKDKAKEILLNERSILIDIRDSESFAESHDNRSININNENLGSFISDTPKEYPILVLCYHGNSSQSIASYLFSQGFTDVYSIDGGYEEWRDEF